LKSLDSRCSLPLSVVIEGGNDGSKQFGGFYESITMRQLQKNGRGFIPFAELPSQLSVQSDSVTGQNTIKYRAWTVLIGYVAAQHAR
jgi:hypothetical protein